MEIISIGNKKKMKRLNNLEYNVPFHLLYVIRYMTF